MNVIHKATLGVGVNDLNLPLNAVILSAHVHDDHICIWYHCDPGSGNGFGPRRVVVVSNSWSEEMPSLLDHRFIGTAIGNYVWHVFEMKSS